MAPQSDQVLGSPGNTAGPEVGAQHREFGSADAGEPGHFRFEEADLKSKDGAMGAVVAHVLARPDGIRARAQVSASISAASAAALAAFGSLTGLSDRDAWLRWLVVAAVTMWLVSLALYLRAITRSHGEFTPQTANGMLDEFRSYAKNVRASVKRGTYATFVAIAVTVAAALALAADSIIPRAEREVTLALHSDAWRALSQLCKHEAADTLTAEVRPADLGLATVPLRMRCRSRDALEVHMRRDWILAARLVN